MLVSLEGPEGAGKSTLARRLDAALHLAGYPSLLTYEPGGTALGRGIRQIVRFGGGPTLGPPAALDARAEALLFCAARAQLVAEVIRPHLLAGGVVVCDRYADSTLAYQCYGRGLPFEPVRATLAFATSGVWPDLTVLLDLDVAEGLRRKRGSELAGVDRFESEAVEFHQRVRRGYRELAAAEPGRWLVIDATRPAAEVAALAWAEVRRRLEG